MKSIQYNWKYRKYSTREKTSMNFDEVVPDKVNIKVTPEMYISVPGRNTPFEEVVLNPYHGTPDLTSFLRTLEPRREGLGYIWNEFKQAIFEGWMLDKIHVIGASSGYDSRMIAKAVQELTKEYGTDWLGETYFVECAGEPEGFSEAMKRLGWYDKNAISASPQFEFEYFTDLHKRFNGLCAYPMNQWYDFYIRNWNEEDIQYISGYGGNVADAMNPNSPHMGIKKKVHTIGGRLMMYFRKQYFYQISAFREPKYSFHPFWSWRYINATAGCDFKTDRMSVLLADTFIPECRRVKRMRILGEVTANGHRTVSKKVVSKLHDWYTATRYGELNPCVPSATIEYNQWWLKLCIANYVEANNIHFR